MNQPELESILKKARLPEISGESLEMFPRRIVAGLKRNDPGIRLTRNYSPHLAWAFGLAACVVIAFAIGHWRGKMETAAIPATETDSLASTKLVRETLALFPNRVRAIVQDERGLNLVLSDNDDVPVSSPLYVRICDGKLTVLADARGEIILTGNQFVWSDRERTYAGNHLKIEAKNLGALAM
jgi:hypothetical protein